MDFSSVSATLGVSYIPAFATRQAAIGFYCLSRTVEMKDCLACPNLFAVIAITSGFGS